MENPKIKIIREFKEYAYYNPLNVFKELKKTGTNINIFGNQVAICISEEDISFYIWFGIVGDIFNTKKIDVETIPFNHSIILKTKEETTYTIYFQSYLNRFFMLLSSSKRSKESQSLLEDMYGDDIFHIYGIWEVKLSKEFEQELFYSED